MYVITKKNTYEVNNEVYFAETFNEAEDRQYELIEKSNNTEEWIIASVVDP